MRSFCGGILPISRNFFISAGVWFFCSLAFGSPALDKKVTFSEAIEIAIERSPSLSVSRSELDVRELEYKNSYSAFLPSLDFVTQHGLRDNIPSTYSNVYGSDLSLQLTENLYDNGVSFTRYQSAKIKKDIADLSFRNDRDKLVLSVATEYMRYSLAQSLAEVQEQQFNIINKQYQSVANQYQQGVKTRRDYLRFKTELRRAEIDLQTSRTATEKSRLELMRLLGYEMKDGIAAFDFKPIEIQTSSVGPIPTRAPAIDEHYQYRIAALQKKIYENDVYIIKRAYWPELFASAGVTYHSGDYLADNVAINENETTSWNALLTLKFNLWDWGSRRRNVAVAEIRKSQAENTIANDLNSFAAENQKLMLELQQSAKNFSLAQELLSLESNSYNFLDAEYRRGQANYLDIIVGLRDFLSSKVQMYTSYYELREQLLKYHYYEGHLYESLVKK